MGLARMNKGNQREGQHQAQQADAETAEKSCLRDVAGNGRMRGVVIVRDAENIHQAALCAVSAGAEGIAPDDTAAQDEQGTEHLIGGMNDRAEQLICCGNLCAGRAESQIRPAERTADMQRHAQRHQKERGAEVRDEFRNQRGAGIPNLAS